MRPLSSFVNTVLRVNIWRVAVTVDSDDDKEDGRPGGGESPSPQGA